MIWSWSSFPNIIWSWSGFPNMVWSGSGFQNMVWYGSGSKRDITVLIYQIYWLSCPKKKVKGEFIISKLCRIRIQIRVVFQRNETGFFLTVGFGSGFILMIGFGTGSFPRKSDLDPGQLHPAPQPGFLTRRPYCLEMLLKGLSSPQLQRFASLSSLLLRISFT